MVVRSALVALERIVVDEGLHHGNMFAYGDLQASIRAVDPGFPMAAWMAFARDLRASRVRNGWG